MQTNEGRALVLELATADDVESAVIDFVDRGEKAYLDEIDDSAFLGVLKVAEYALLVDPISSGVRTALDKWEDTFLDSMGFGSIEDIGYMVGEHTLCEVFPKLESRLEAITEIAQRRSFFLNGTSGVRSQYSKMVCPFDLNLRAASRNAGISACLSVVSCVLATERSPESSSMSIKEKLDVVKSSPQLFLAQPMVHLGDLPMSASILDADNEMALSDLEVSRLVKFDPVHRRVRLKQGIRDWSLVWNPRTIADRNSEALDVRLGCPFTFTPKSSRVEYYERVAQLIYDTGHWHYSLGIS